LSLCLTAILSVAFCPAYSSLTPMLPAAVQKYPQPLSYKQKWVTHKIVLPVS